MQVPTTLVLLALAALVIYIVVRVVWPLALPALRRAGTHPAGSWARGGDR
ncbi:MAG: hypothetical protein ACRDRK_13610 [Pseudonocardia sp.]